MSVVKSQAFVFDVSNRRRNCDYSAIGAMSSPNLETEITKNRCFESDSIFQREDANYEDFRRFHLTSRTFSRQYASIYQARLAILKQELKARANVLWGRPVLQLDQLNPDEIQNDDRLCAIIGTIYKYQELKPSILKELSNELQLVPQPVKHNYSSLKDQLFMEDETMKVKLIGKHIDIEEIVTGIVCALLGRVLDDGSFYVESWCFPDCPAISTTSNINLTIEDIHILLLSGLDFCNSPDSMSLKLLIEFICGLAGNERIQREVASIVRVIIAGNSIRGSVETYKHKGYFKNKNHDLSVAKESAISTHRFDEFLANIASSCCVTLMPGEFDPSCHSLPQQPFHSTILPKSSRFRTLHSVTNPWVGKIGTRIIAGTSGQPIRDIMKVAGLVDKSSLHWLEKTLLWRHFAPTAPDTLPSYPYFDNDPFIIKECPDIYFAGNMEKFQTNLYQGKEGQTVRLICIPKFSETQTAVLVNLKNLDTRVISFGVS